MYRMHTDCVPIPVLHVSIVPTGTLVTSEAVDSFKSATGATVHLQDLSNPTLCADYDPFMHIR